MHQLNNNFLFNIMISIPTTRINLTMLRKHNTWYTITDGNWSNPNTWISNGKRKNSLPQPGDDVYIDNNIVVDTAATTNNLYVAGSLTAGTNSITLTINGDLQETGPLNFTGSNITIILNGYNNNVNSFTAGNTTVKYNRAGDQNVLPVTYKNLLIYNTGIKYLSANTIIQGNLNVNDYMPQDAVLECGNYDLTVNGNTSITFGVGTSSYNFSKSGVGKLLFIGAVAINSNTHFSSNITNIEIRGGANLSGLGGYVIFNCPVSFTTNSQTLAGSNTIFNNSIIISGAITITNTNNSLYLNNGVNGDNINSTLNNNGFIYVGSPNTIMNSGIFNYMNTASSSIGYVLNSDFTLPYVTYGNLTIMGTGIKTLSGNTTVLNLNINNYDSAKARLDCSSYNLTVNGSTSVTGLGSGDTLDAGLIKSGNGSITFIGFATFNTANIGFSSNVILEFRSGVNFGPYGVHSGTIDGSVNFTTASQNLQGGDMTFNGKVNISGGIILTTNGGGFGHYFKGLINGSSASDTLKNAGAISYQNSTSPMQTGVLDCNSLTNTFYYNLLGNQDITATTYRNLTLSGNGIKRLLGNVSVSNIYSLLSPATLNMNSYTLGNP